MIYALLDPNQPHSDCFAIADAVQKRDAAIIQHWENNRVIAHVMQASTLPGPFYCLYCRDIVVATDVRPPRGHHAADSWHFEHNSNGACIAHVRNPPLRHALGVENPTGHGCYGTPRLRTVSWAKPEGVPND